eukprot:3281966-Rhodomonas_salina.2
MVGSYILDDHHKEGKLDAQGLVLISRASNVVGADVGPHDFEDRRLNILVGDALDMPVPHLLVPNLQRLAPDTVENGQEAGLE